MVAPHGRVAWVSLQGDAAGLGGRAPSLMAYTASSLSCHGLAIQAA
jgi:hypothetical protein